MKNILIKCKEIIDMPNDDTIKLLNECDAGIKMGVEGIKEVIGEAENKELVEISENLDILHTKLTELKGIMESIN
mgnify:CR=1 FL=1